MEQINSNKKHSDRRKYFALLAVVLFIALSGAYAYWSMELKDMISTDDAYVTGNADPISAQVSGSVTVVNHKDTNYVRQGDILVSQDKTDATIALNKAKNNLANIVRQTNKLYLQDKQYSAEVASARIQYQQSLEDYNRRVPLAKQGVISKETLEHTKDTLISSKAALNAAIQAYKANKALVMNTPLNRQPQVVEAADATKEAWLALKRTDIKSPVTGYIAQRSVQVGETVSPGQSLMAVVPARQMWVNANFKETQIANMKIGQKAWFTVDALNHQKFTGHVEEISPAAGSEFSVLKPDNTTGNFTKVVQRIAVRIAIDPNQTGIENLRPGMSVISSVDTHSAQR